MELILKLQVDAMRPENAVYFGVEALWKADETGNKFIFDLFLVRGLAFRRPVRRSQNDSRLGSRFGMCFYERFE